ncbi:MAG: type II secretion system inner membrane protein GspF [Thioploca sp.]|nr:type II secretion system inner membrane protein GspF [Thioploca sp.]
MSAFEYAALDKAGRTRKGVLEGDTARQIRQRLREQGLIPLAIEEVVRPAKQRRSRRITINATELALLTQQLATLVRSGLTVEGALRAVAEQSEIARIKSLLLAVRSRVLEGHNLANGLREFPKVFSELYCATIDAGEQAGYLEVVLERLAEYTENRHSLQQKMLLALLYPGLLSIVAILVVLGLLTYVVPQVVQVFNHVQQQLPLLTRSLIVLSDGLRDWGGTALLLLIGIVALLRYSLQFEQPLIFFHSLLLRLPIISRLERGANVARFTRTLNILSKSGVPMLESLRITEHVMSNRLLRKAVKSTTDKVREGTSLQEALKQTGLFPPMITYLIASGETSGRLDEMLERAAIWQERELETLLNTLLSLFEPLLILVMGGLVLTIVLAILLPIFELNRLIA